MMKEVRVVFGGANLIARNPHLLSPHRTNTALQSYSYVSIKFEGMENCLSALEISAKKRRRMTAGITK